jgi:hypothetical protein
MRLVLIYLGDTVPKHFWQSAKQLLNMQSGYPIDIITSEHLVDKPIHDLRIRYFKYEPQPDVTRILDSLAIDKSFRNGFWRYSLERLFAFTQHHAQFTRDSILHIESDILLFKNFPFTTFEKLNKLSWSKVDENRDVGALIFSPTPESSKWLQETMCQLVKDNNNTDDMKLLSQISRNHKSRILILPSIPTTKSQLLNLQIEITEENCESLCSEFASFQGIFDPAGLGIWLTGTDPRNQFGLTKKFDHKLLFEAMTYIDPSKIEYKYDSDFYLSYLENNQRVPIYTLHIHSKNEKYFNPGVESVVAADVKKSSLGKISTEFSLRVLIDLVIHNWRKGTLLGFLSWLPLAKKTKKLLKIAIRKL